MRRALSVLLSGSLLCLAGCFKSESDDAITFQIRTTESTNRGNPVHVVIKETSAIDFWIDGYPEISKLLWTEKEEDPSCHFKDSVIPGKTAKIRIEKVAKDKSLGIYFLFTNPKESWKYLIPDPQSQNVKISLGEDECEAINIFKS